MNSIKSVLLIMLFASWTSSAIAGSGAASANSGVIHFYGTIVTGGCAITPQSDVELQTSCNQNGEVFSQTAPLTLSHPQALPLNQGNTRFSWLDRSKKLALITVNYH